MYAALHFPNFELQARLRDDPAAARHPAALLDESPNVRRRKDKHRIVQLNRAARESGVEAGMTATQGQARCADLRLFTRDTGREQSAREAILFHAASLSPRLEATAPGLCTLDLKGLDQRPETLRQLAERARDTLAKLNLRARVGIAANPNLAALVARHARPLRLLENDRAHITAFLHPLPVSALDLDAHTRRILGGWGIATLGQLTALPAEEVIRRLGGELISAHELAGGGRDRPLQLHEPAMELTEAADIEHPIEKLEALIFILNRFLNQIVARLEAVYLVAESLSLKLRFEDDTVFEREFRIPDPTRDTRILLRTLHTFLESFTSQAPVIGVALGARSARAVERQLDLFQTALRDPNQFAETLARLDALLGPNHVGSPVIDPGHRPDAVKVGPFQPDDPQRRRQPAAIPDEAPRFGPALRRFRPPLPVRVQVRQNSERELLIRIDSQELRGRVEQSRGPWKQSGDWWDVSTGWSREEWDVQLAQGPLLRLARENETWLLDGIYD